MIIQPTFVGHEPFVQVLGGIVDDFLVHELGRHATSSTAPKENFADDIAVDLELFPTANDDGKKRRGDLSVSFRNSLLSSYYFDSTPAIGVVTITRKSDVYRFWYLISRHFSLHLTITRHTSREQSSSVASLASYRMQYNISLQFRRNFTRRHINLLYR